MTMWRVFSASALALLCAASMQPQQAAVAQGMMQQTQAAPSPVRVRATITSIDGGVLTAKARDGVEMKVKLADNAPVNEIVKVPLDDVKTGVYVAVTGMPQPDGSQKALAVFIFPEAQRGLAEGHRPWDFAPNSTMTPATEITAATRKSAADLKPGQKITVFAAKKLPDGTLEAPNIAFGDYGVWR